MASVAEAQIPVIWELDDQGEGTGQTYRFCGAPCADQFSMEALPQSEQFQHWACGFEPTVTVLDGERCMTCGSEIGR